MRPGRRLRAGAAGFGLLAAFALHQAAERAPASTADTRGEAGSGTMTAGTQEGRVVLVTGSTGGLGREVALRLGAAGAHVIVHGRNVERGREVVEQIEATGKGSARFYPADFASLAEVRRLAEEVRRDYDRIDLLVNNAGIFLPEGERQLSEDGNELHLQVNYLAGFLLTRALLPLLERAAPSRIVNVASGAQRALDFSDPNLERGYDGWRAYAQSKLAQVMFTIDLAEELRDRGITVVSLHPATFMDTDMVREAGITPRSTVDEGADAVMHLIDSPDMRSGQYFEGMQPATPAAQALDPEARQRLRELTEQLLD